MAFFGLANYSMYLRKRIDQRFSYFSSVPIVRHSLNDIFNSRPKIAYIGWLHSQNVGDDIIFEVLSRKMKSNILFASYPHIPIEFAISRYINSQHFCQFFVFGGGTILCAPSFIGAVEREINRGHKFCTFGSGVWSELDSLGVQGSNGDRWRSALAHATAVSVRGPKSKSMLAALIPNADIKIIGDPGLSASSVFLSPGNITKKLVGINIGSHKDGSLSERFLNDLVPILRDLVSDGFDLIGLIMHDLDREFTHRALIESGQRTPNIIAMNKKIEDVVKFSSLEFVISQRLHASILAHSYGVPCIALAYDEKVTDHFLAMKQEDFNLLPAELSSESIRDRVNEIRRFSEEIRSTICKRRDLYVARQYDYLRVNILPACLK